MEASLSSILTRPELSVTIAIAAGHSTKQVASDLFVSPRTVEFHLNSVFRKLRVRNRAALLRELARRSATAVGPEASR